jgi:hypothetical protein
MVSGTESKVAFIQPELRVHGGLIIGEIKGSLQFLTAPNQLPHWLSTQLKKQTRLLHYTIAFKVRQ